MHMRARNTLGLLLLLAVAVAQPAEAAKRGAPTCAKDGTATVRQSAAVRVYSELTDEGNDVTHDSLYGCWRATGRRIRLTLGYSSSGFDQSYANVRLAGHRVALSVKRSSDACKYGCTDRSAAGSGAIEVTDVKLRRRLRSVSLPFPGLVSDVALTGRGGVAWITGNQVQVADGLSTRTLDTGVVPDSLDAAGLSTVSWVRDGTERFALLAGGSAAPPPRLKARHSCATKGSRAVAQSQAARLFTVTRVGTARLYGCLTAVGRRVQLAEAGDIDDLYSSTAFEDVRLAGRYAAWYGTTTDVSCKASCPPDYQATLGRVHVFDLRRRRSVRAVRGTVDGRGLVLTDGGAVAWLSGNRLLAADRSGGRTLDTGTIADSSLRVDGSIVSWVRDGIERFARLR